jgi:hypothetical protein
MLCCARNVSGERATSVSADNNESFVSHGHAFYPCSAVACPAMQPFVRQSSPQLLCDGAPLVLTALLRAHGGELFPEHACQQFAQTF